MYLTEKQLNILNRIVKIINTLFEGLITIEVKKTIWSD